VRESHSVTCVRRSFGHASGYYSEELHGPHEVFELGDFPLESGETLPNAKLLGARSSATDRVPD